MMEVAADVNGGNAEVAREDSNLNLERGSGAVVPESPEKPYAEPSKMDDVEINGDMNSPSKKAMMSPSGRRKIRKMKTNFGGLLPVDGSSPKGTRRKPSEIGEMSSGESEEFNGFDKDFENREPGNRVLKKLIAEAESVSSPSLKRRKTGPSVWKSTKNADTLIDEGDENTTDSEDQKMNVDLDTSNVPVDESSLKSEKSANSSISMASNRSKRSRSSRGASPASGRHKIALDLTNPVYKEPFKYGWKRELVYRATSGSENSVKRMADIYYYTPEGKKVRSFREVVECLTSSELTIDNFTFFKDPLGVNDPEKEIIRDAKQSKQARMRESLGAGKSTPKMAKKSAEIAATPVKKPSPKKVAEKVTPVAASKAATPKAVKTTPATFKVKLPSKKNTSKKEMKSPPVVPVENEPAPPQTWASPTTTKRNLPIVEKSPPVKTKRAPKAKVQEPCSIRCSTSMGLIPSLQCSVCLCLYHPECVGGTEIENGDDYVCKNCQQDVDEAQLLNPTLTPPPLIPISLMGAQNSKTKHQTGTLPKLQRIPKSETSDSSQRELSKSSKSSTFSNSTSSCDKESSWFDHAGTDFLPTHDGSPPKPAQNIAVMGGKRYIVVPKNNSMAVQPAITIRPDKIGDKPPLIPESIVFNASGMSDNVDSLLSPNQGETEPKTPELNDTDDISNIKNDLLNTNDNLLNVEEDLSNLKEGSLNHDKDTSNEVVDKKIIENNGSNSKTDSLPEQEYSEIASAMEIGVDDPKKENSLPNSPTPVDNDPTISNIEADLAYDKLRKSLESPLTVIEENEVSPSEQAPPLKLSSSSKRKRRKQMQPEDPRQHFMVSVCAGYHALSRIFQYLKVQELLRAARICRMWRDLAAHPSLWKTVRMKNSQVTDWDGFAETLKNRGTQNLDLRKMLISGESDTMWKKFVTVIPRVTSLIKLELCRCPVMVVQEVIKNCPQLKVLSATTIICDTLNLESIGNLKCCQELRLKANSGMSLVGDLSALQDLTHLQVLSLISVKDLGKKNVQILQNLENLETLELGDCSDFPDKFGTEVLTKLHKLERLRLEKGQGTCCTFDILEGISKLPSLIQLELVNFDVKNGFDKYLAGCKNIKRLLVIPTYISQSATSNNMLLGGVTELSNNLTHFVWGVTLELLRVTELFVDQCNQMNKQITGDSIPVLKPVPCLKLIEDVDDNQKSDENMTNPQVDILPLPQLQKLLLTALPKTRVKILKIPFHATWRQVISDTGTQ